MAALVHVIRRAESRNLAETPIASDRDPAAALDTSIPHRIIDCMISQSPSGTRWLRSTRSASPTRSGLSGSIPATSTVASRTRGPGHLRVGSEQRQMASAACA
jgi:hypothetical protein